MEAKRKGMEKEKIVEVKVCEWIDWRKTDEDVMDALRKMDGGKTSGLNGTKVELLKYGGNSIRELFRYSIDIWS